MEFHEKLQLLRKQQGLTQEELAARLYVSRTAVSKWESGRGYPNIDSLKALAAQFSVTLDELLSADEVLHVAAEDRAQKKTFFCRLIFGLLDLCACLLLFLPFFAERDADFAYARALFALEGAQPYMRVLYAVLISLLVLWGVLTLTLQTLGSVFWGRVQPMVSLGLSALMLLTSILGMQPYAAIFVLALLAVKLLVLARRH